MFEPSTKFENALCFSRFDASHWLAPNSAHPIELDERIWPTAEHYYQANKFSNRERVNAIAQAVSAEEAYRLGNRWFQPKRSNFKSLRPVIMTRALYTKACMYEELRQVLLESKDQPIVETSSYGHYWGIGRDQRGSNQLGKIWADIRTKLQESA